LQTIDLAKDPYFMKNHLGSYECKLCLTLHNNEGSYLAHTQGKRHQTNLQRRAARDAKEREGPLPIATMIKKSLPKKTIKIGRPGYKVTKTKDAESGHRGLIFEIEYLEIEEGLQPRHRFMSAYEQKVEAPDKKYQYLLFAAEPYEIIGFKIPNEEIERDIDSKHGINTNWDRDKLIFTLRLHFKLADKKKEEQKPQFPLPLPS